MYAFLTSPLVWFLAMDSALDYVELLPSSSIRMQGCIVADTYINFEQARRGRTDPSKKTAFDVRVYLGADFVNPRFAAEILRLVSHCCFVCRRLGHEQCACGAKQRVKCRVHHLSCLCQWTFKADTDPRLKDFDAFYEELDDGPIFLQPTHLPQVRVLIPQQLKAFLRAHVIESDLRADYFLQFQHFQASLVKRRDTDDYYAKLLFQALEGLKAERTRESEDVQKMIDGSARVQKILIARAGTANVLVGNEDEETLTPESLEAFERGLKLFEEDDEEPYDAMQILGPRSKRKSLLANVMRGFCNERARMPDSFGNIIANSGASTIIGENLPCVVISRETARRLPCWDEDLVSDLPDLLNAAFLDIIAAGPLNDGGGWTVHIDPFNEALHIPDGLGTREEARRWHASKLTDLCCSEFLRANDAISIDDMQEARSLAAELLCRGAEGEKVLQESRSLFVSWVNSPPNKLLLRALLEGRFVTAVQRHARTGDRVSVVRHPMGAAHATYAIMVSLTLNGMAIMLPPQYANLAEHDYDGDRVKLAIERAQSRRRRLEECFSVPRLMYTALGDRNVKLSGNAAPALNLAQQGGASVIRPDGLSFAGLPYRKGVEASEQTSETPLDRAAMGIVVWKGILEPVYDVDYFLEAVLPFVGLAVPHLLARHWSEPNFQEVRFVLRMRDGSMRASEDTPISYDGFYPVPRHYGCAQQEAWIAVAVARND